MLQKFSALTRNFKTQAVEQQMNFTMGDTRYVIKNIDGLGPIKNDVSTIDTPVDPGGTFIATRTGQRNIVVTIGFNPNYTINEDVTTLRYALLKVFTPGYKIEMTFENFEAGFIKTYKMNGVVETNEPVIFSPDPQVQISIICPYPYFTAVENAVVWNLPYGSNTFSYVNPYLLPISFKLEFDINAAHDWFDFILESASNTSMGISFALVAGDKVRFNTNKGFRELVYIRSAATVNAMAYITGSLVDMRLHPGRNWIRFNEIGWTNNAKITYQPIYPGL